MGKENLTISEQMFEKFCNQNSIKFKKIPTENNPTPDYEFFPNGKKVIAEITQMDQNDEENEMEKELKKRESYYRR